MQGKEIVERVGKVAYRLVLPVSTKCIHDVFHISSLWKYVNDPLSYAEDWGGTVVWGFELLEETDLYPR